jgi:hypothetical protein
VAHRKVCDQPVADKVMGLRRGPWGYLRRPPGAARAHISIEPLDELPERLTLVSVLPKGLVSIAAASRLERRAAQGRTYPAGSAAVGVDRRRKRGGVGRCSGGGRGGCRSTAGVAPELEEVVGATQQLPLGVAGSQAAAGEPAGALLLLELPEDRLHGLLALGVAGLALALPSLAAIAARRPSLLDSDGWPSLRGLP